ncbi:hypothetical protein ACFC0D_20190 [Streptomyces sp. NPDC056222]|uniref:hypothetical protein n=1 Tax=Streptomyces sp. NPDC056222 TaxID=3345749 RepID=UPI0035DB4946
MDSDRFERIWTTAGREAHDAVVKALTGGGRGALEASGGTVTLDVGEAVDRVKEDRKAPDPEAVGGRAELQPARRLARDHETLPGRSEAMIHLTMTDLLARLADEAAISWRDPITVTKRPVPG